MVAQQLLKVTRTSVTTQLASAPGILGLSSTARHRGGNHAGGQRAARRLRRVHLPVRQPRRQPVREDSTKLKKLANDYAYSKLAGGSSRPLRPRPPRDGQGMAEGGGSSNPMIVGMGMGMAGQVAAAPGQPLRDARAPNFAGAPVAGAGYPAARPRAFDNSPGRTRTRGPAAEARPLRPGR